MLAIEILEFLIFDLVVLGPEVSDASKYLVACRQCFKGGVASKSKALQASSSEAESITSSSNSDSEVEGQ